MAAARPSIPIGSRADRFLGVAFLVPALLLLVVILVGPFFYTTYLSFTDLSYSIPGRDGNFVGFDNYRRLVREDAVFWHSAVTTLKFVLFAVSAEFVLGLGIAMLLLALSRRRVILTMLLVPMMLAPVTVGLIGKLILQGEFGMLTYYLRAVGLLAQDAAVLSDPALALWAVILIDIWQWTPFVTLVLFAGMLSLPREPYEAAMMDGAGAVRIFVDITLPLLRPIIALCLLLRGIDAFKEFDKVFIMTGGGPGTATELLSIYTYRVSFRDWDLGYGAVCAFLVYLVVLILCSFFYKALSGRPEGAP